MASNKGEVTCTMTNVLSDATDASSIQKNNLYSTIYYDKYGHVLRTISDNHLGGRDVLTNLYEDITFQINQSKQEHYNGSEQITLEKWFEYDHTGRLLATHEKINDQPEITLNAMRYNEVGEVITKYLHSNQTTGARSFIQKTDYRYNIRGWLTKINDPVLGDDNDMFGMQLFYNSTTGMGSLAPGQGLFNGNITGMKWGIKSEAVRGYQFSYDNLNRLLQSNYAESSSLNSNTGYYSEIVNNYDKNGNIQNLQRYYNNTRVDSLTYRYVDKTNQIRKVYDSGTASSAVDDYPGTSQNYTYDANGNMIYDGAKNLNIYYNSTLNLPKQLDFGSNNRIFYHYTATGAKLVKHSVPGTGTGVLTHYIGNIVYEGSTLIYIITDEGRLVANGTGADRKFLYEYNIKDHLGNDRVTFMGTDLGGAVDIVQTTNYYPFGLVMNQMNGNTAPGYKKNKYLYNGKELQDDVLEGSSLNWYDYGSRFLDPQIGRWTTSDPLAEKAYDWSPYRYGFDNPISTTDPDGMLEDWVERKNGKIEWDNDVTSANDADLRRGETWLGKNVLVGNHNRDNNLNEPINSARFDLYLESDKSGPSATIYGNTVPSDVSKFGTMAEGLYPAESGSRASYVQKGKEDLAILINGGKDVPTVRGNPNKVNSDMLDGVFFHKGNPYQKSLRDATGNPVWSHGCQTSGSGPGSLELHNTFMKEVGTDFKGSYYLRAQPQYRFISIPVTNMPTLNFLWRRK